MPAVNNNKLLAIVGPTASGKTKLAVRLARQFDGEVVSADSRQVYRGMDVGTGKDLGEFRMKNKELRITNIPYHCIDVASPKTEFNLAKYLKHARRAIADIQQRGKLPIVVGGTGLYAQALVEGYNLSGVTADKALRARLDKKSANDLQAMLTRLDPTYTGDMTNKRYLIRYIELVQQTKQPLQKLLTKIGGEHEWLVIGIDVPRDELNKKIDRRLKQRLQNAGLIAEVERLHRQGISWKRLESFGLEYRFVSQYLQRKLDEEELFTKLSIAIHQFAKRQMTWLRRWERQGRTIIWVSGYNTVKKQVGAWLKS